MISFELIFPWLKLFFTQDFLHSLVGSLVQRQQDTISELREFIADRRQHLDRINKRTLWSLRLAQQYALQLCGPDWQSTAEFSRVNSLLQATKDYLISRYNSSSNKQEKNMMKPYPNLSLDEWLDDFDMNDGEDDWAENNDDNIKINVKNQLVKEAKQLEQILIDSGNLPNKDQVENGKVEMGKSRQEQPLTSIESEIELNSNTSTKSPNRTLKGMEKQKQGHCRKKASPPKSSTRGRRGRRGRSSRILSIMDDSEDSSGDDDDEKNSESLRFDKLVSKFGEEDNLTFFERLPELQNDVEEVKIDDENGYKAERNIKPLISPNKPGRSQREKKISFVKENEDLESGVPLWLLKRSGRLPSNSESLKNIPDEENFVDQVTSGKMQFEKNFIDSENGQRNSNIASLKDSKNEGTESEQSKRTKSENNKSILETCRINSESSIVKKIERGPVEFMNGVDAGKEYTIKENVVKDIGKVNNSPEEKTVKDTEMVNNSGEQEEGSEGNEHQLEDTQRDPVIQHIMDQVKVLHSLGSLENLLSDHEGDGTGYANSTPSCLGSSSKGSIGMSLESFGNQERNPKSLVEDSELHGMHDLLSPISDEEDEDMSPVFLEDTVNNPPRCLNTQISQGFSTGLNDSMLDDLNITDSDDPREVEDDREVEGPHRGVRLRCFQSSQSFSFEVEDAMNGSPTLSNTNVPQAEVCSDLPSPKCASTTQNDKSIQGVTSDDILTPKPMNHEFLQDRVTSDFSSQHTTKPMKGSDLFQVPSPKGGICLNIPSSHRTEPQKENNISDEPPQEAGLISDKPVQFHQPIECEEERTRLQAPFSITNVRAKREKVSICIEEVTCTVNSEVIKEKDSEEDPEEWWIKNSGAIKGVGAHDKREQSFETNGVEREKVVEGSVENGEKCIESSGDEGKECENADTKGGVGSKIIESAMSVLKPVRPKLQKLQNLCVASDSADIIELHRKKVFENLPMRESKFKRDERCESSSSQTICDKPQVSVKGVSSIELGDSVELDINSGSQHKLCKSNVIEAPCVVEYQERGLRKCAKLPASRNKDTEGSIFDVSSDDEEENGISNVAMDHHENDTVNDSVQVIQDTKSPVNRQSKGGAKTSIPSLTTVTTSASNYEKMEHQETNFAKQDDRLENSNVKTNPVTSMTIETSVNNESQRDHMKISISNDYCLIRDNAETTDDERTMNQTSIASAIHMKTSASGDVRGKKACKVTLDRNAKVSRASKRSQSVLSRMQKYTAPWVDQEETELQLPSRVSITSPIDTSPHPPQPPFPDTFTTQRDTSPQSPLTDSTTTQTNVPIITTHSTTYHIDTTIDSHAILGGTPDSTHCTITLINSAENPTDTQVVITDIQDSCTVLTDKPESTQKVLVTQKETKTTENSINGSSEISSIVTPGCEGEEVEEQEDGDRIHKNNCRSMSDPIKVSITKEQELTKDPPGIDGWKDEGGNKMTGGRKRRRSIRIAEMEKMKTAKQEKLKEMFASHHRNVETDTNSNHTFSVTDAHEFERASEGLVNWNEVFLATSFNSDNSLYMKETETSLKSAFDEEIPVSVTCTNPLNNEERKSGNLMNSKNNKSLNMTPSEPSNKYEKNPVLVIPRESANNRKNSITLAKEDSEPIEKVDREPSAKEISNTVEEYGDDQARREKDVAITKPKVGCEAQPRNWEIRATSATRASTVSEPHKGRVVFVWGGETASNITKKQKGGVEFVLKHGIRHEIPNISSIVKHNSFSLEKRKIKTLVTENACIEKQLKISVNNEQDSFEDVFDKVPSTKERNTVGLKYSKCQPEKWRGVKSTKMEKKYQEKAESACEKIAGGNRLRNIDESKRTLDVRQIRKRKSGEPSISKQSVWMKTSKKTQGQRLTNSEEAGTSNDEVTEGKLSDKPVTKRRILVKNLFGSDSSSSDVDSDVCESSIQIKAKKDIFSTLGGKARCGKKKGSGRVAAAAEQKVKRVNRSEKILEKNTSSDMSFSSLHDDSNTSTSMCIQKRASYDSSIDNAEDAWSTRRLKLQQKGARHPPVSTPTTKPSPVPDFTQSENEDEMTVSEIMSDEEEEDISDVTNSEFQHLSPGVAHRHQANMSSSMEASDSDASNVLLVRRSQKRIRSIESDLDSGKEMSDTSMMDRKKPVVKKYTRKGFTAPLKRAKHNTDQSITISGSVKNLKLERNLKNKKALEVRSKTGIQGSGMKEAHTPKYPPKEQLLNKNRERLSQENKTAAESEVDVGMNKVVHNEAGNISGSKRIKGTKTAAEDRTDSSALMGVKKNAFIMTSRLQAVHSQEEGKKRMAILLASPPPLKDSKCQGQWSGRSSNSRVETCESKSHEPQSCGPKSHELESTDSESFEFYKCDSNELLSCRSKWLETNPFEANFSKACKESLIIQQCENQERAVISREEKEGMSQERNSEDQKNNQFKEDPHTVTQDVSHNDWKPCVEKDTDTEEEPVSQGECWDQDLHIDGKYILKDMNEKEHKEDLSRENKEDSAKKDVEVSTKVNEKDSGKRSTVEEGSSAREEQKNCSIYSEYDSSDSDSQLEIDYYSPSKELVNATVKLGVIAEFSEGPDKSEICQTSEPAPVVSHPGIPGCLAKVGSMERPAVKPKTKTSPAKPQPSSSVPGNAGFVDDLFIRLGKKTNWNRSKDEPGQKSLESNLQMPSPIVQQLTVIEGKHTGYQAVDLHQVNRNPSQHTSYTQMAGYQGIDYQGDTPIPLPCFYGSLKNLPLVAEPQLAKDSLGTSFSHKSSHNNNMNDSRSNDNTVPTEDSAQFPENPEGTQSSQDAQQCKGSPTLHPRSTLVKDVLHKTTTRDECKPEVPVYIPRYSCDSVQRSSRGWQRKYKDTEENEDSYMERLEELLSYRTNTMEWSGAVNGLVASLASTSSHTPFLKSCVQAILGSNPKEVRATGLQFGLPPTLFKLFQVVCVCEIRLCLPQAHFRTQLLRAIHVLICRPGLSLQPHSVGSLTAWFLATVSVPNQPITAHLTMDLGRAFLVDVILCHPSAAHLALLTAVTITKKVFRRKFPDHEVTGVEDVLVWLSYHGACSGRGKVRTELGAWLEGNKSVTKPQKNPSQLVTKLVTQLKASGSERRQEDLVTGLLVLAHWLGAKGVRTYILPSIHKVLGKLSHSPSDTTSNLSIMSQQLFPPHINHMFERLEQVFEAFQVNAEMEESVQYGKLAAQELKATLGEVLKLASSQKEVLSVPDAASTSTST
ncbi:hypothetical protein Pcinc_019711 [Petrolisthes cinctipes]|uniref:Uncharacterized protein n=1 Tax=Petrolisthes cinctipes TaxID=88211 RepID=A0AAE1FJK8_PETCI|nr:hypothetical protein Pcinc_019711 [Petrolisthes cinctipes]